MRLRKPQCALIMAVHRTAVHEGYRVARQGHHALHVHVIHLEADATLVIHRIVEHHDVVVAQAAPPPCADALHTPVREVQRRVEPRTEDRLVHPYLVARKQRGRHRVRRDDERVGHQGTPTVVHDHAQHNEQPHEAHAARHLIRHAPCRLHRPPSVSLRRTQTITARPANTQTP